MMNKPRPPPLKWLLSSLSPWLDSILKFEQMNQLRCRVCYVEEVFRPISWADIKWNQIGRQFFRIDDAHCIWRWEVMVMTRKYQTDWREFPDSIHKIIKKHQSLTKKCLNFEIPLEQIIPFNKTSVKEFLDFRFSFLQQANWKFPPKA